MLPISNAFNFRFCRRRSAALLPVVLPVVLPVMPHVSRISFVYIYGHIYAYVMSPAMSFVTYPSYKPFNWVSNDANGIILERLFVHNLEFRSTVQFVSHAPCSSHCLKSIRNNKGRYGKYVGNFVASCWE